MKELHPLTKQEKADWVKALRSGDYKQAHKTLRGPDGFCCLGVAADVIYPDRWVRSDSESFPWSMADEGHSADDVLHANTTSAVLPEGVLSNKVCCSLYQLNDRDKLSFTEIADYIEENVEAV